MLSHMNSGLCATCLLAAATFALAAPPTTNPADLHREISRLMVKIPNDPTQADDPVAVPTNAALAGYLHQRQPVLDLMHQAAALPRADWGPVDGDIKKVMGSLNNMRAAVMVTWQAARQDIAQNRPADAVTHLLDGMALARHVGQYPLLVCHLVEIGCEVGSIERLAKLLPMLPADITANLPQQLDALPPYVGWPAIIEGERFFGRTTLAEQMKAAGAKADLKVSSSVQAMADALDPLYDAMKGTPGQTPAELDEAVNAVVAKMPDNVLAKTLAPSFARAREPSATLEAKFAMLRVAAATAAGDADALSNSVDPFGGKPFAYKEVAGGYQLQSELVVRGKPVTLTIGN
jgi:hypothetical protein